MNSTLNLPTTISSSERGPGNSGGVGPTWKWSKIT